MLSAGPASAGRISVGTNDNMDYSSIQAGLDAAKPGDTVYVYSGFYRENVDLDKEITVRSISGRPELHIVKAKDSGDHVFHVHSNNVTISGFSIKGANAPDKAGIYLENTRGVMISNNNLSDNRLGICLEDSTGNMLNLNKASGNMVGILLKTSEGNLVMNNKLDVNNLEGILLQASDLNRLNGNILRLNLEHGLLLSNSSGNLIFDNFFYNAANVGYSGTNLENTWNISKHRGISIAGGPYTGGNYWTAPDEALFVIEDLNGDGICDASYDLGECNIDHMPLIRTGGIEQPSHIIAISLFASALIGLALAVYITKKILRW